MPLRFIPSLIDETYRTAWWRFVRRWKPMALWTMLVWLIFGLVLVPLSSAMLGAAVFRGDQIVVANVDILGWLLRPEGILYLLIAGGLAITGTVVRYAGLFRIVTDDVEGTPVSVRQTLLEVLPDLPALFKLSVSVVIAVLVLLVPLAAGGFAIYQLVLGDHDINYYLVIQPPEWRTALILGGAWAVIWLWGATYLVLHSLPALPAYLDGHRPINRALLESWRRTRGSAMRVMWLLFLCVVAWLALRVAAQGTVRFVGAHALDLVEAVTGSLTATILATASYALVSLALDAVVSFVGFSFAATVLIKFYHEHTDLHRHAPAVPPGWRQLPATAAGLVRTWFTPRRLVPVAGMLVLVSGVFTVVVLDQVADQRPVVITAHRTGALLAPENTLAALERSIEARADFAEIDVQRTRDGEVVVVHDADLMRVAGDPRRVADVAYGEIAHLVQGDTTLYAADDLRVATLDQFLDRSRGRIGLNIEPKYYGPDPALADSVVAKIRRHGMDDQVVIMSIDLGAVRQLRALAPDIPLGYVVALAAGDLARLPVDFLAVSRPLATNPLVRAARRRGVEVHVWTLNTAPAMFEVIERGADGIITDDPFLARQVADKFAGLSTPERVLLRMRRTVYDVERAQR